MATSHPRRPWGTAKNTVPAYYRINPEAKDHLSAMAKRMGISVSDLMERVIHEIPLTLDGVPTWWEPAEDEGVNPQGKLDLAAPRSEGTTASQPKRAGGKRNATLPASRVASNTEDSRRIRLAG